MGINVQNNTISEILATAGRVQARGNLAAEWLNEIGFKDFEVLVIAVDAKKGESVFAEEFKKIDETFEKEQAYVYVSETTPLRADAFVCQLLMKYPEAECHWLAGEDLTTHAEIEINPSFMVMDGWTLAGKYALPFDPTQTVALYYPQAGMELDRLCKLMAALYPQGHPVQVFFDRGKDGKIKWQVVKVEELGAIQESIAALLIKARSSDSSLVSFTELIAHLRSQEDGCPWDKKQTHLSLRTYLLEETYEALDALDRGDIQGLREELGDILLQIALHTQIATENKEFNIADVIEGIYRKLVFRHPHIFGEATVEGEKGVLQNWEKLKQQERAENGKDEIKGLLDGIPLSFPSLAQAQAIQDRAARVGFDWDEIQPVMDKVMEEYEEVQSAPNETERAKELGDLLFAVVNLVRWYHVDAESALRGTNIKFRRRFAYIENKSRELNKPMQDMQLPEMDGYWDEAKKLEK